MVILVTSKFCNECFVCNCVGPQVRIERHVMFCRLPTSETTV